MEKESFYKNMLENLYEGVYFVDTERKITFWNKGAERITGFSAEEVTNKFCYNNILNHIDEEGVELCRNGCPLQRTVEDGMTRETKVYLHHKGGHRVPVVVRAIPIKDEEGRIIGAVEAFSDNSKEDGFSKKIEELETLALRDQLTGLPNRRYTDSFITSKVNEFFSLGIPFGICFIDIDKFKNFNDAYGHDVGDEVLKMVAKTYGHVVRSNDLIGRWGGEEFIGVFSGVDAESLSSVCEKLRTLIEKSSINNRGETLKVTISIGATLFKLEDSAETAIKRADELLYQSKENGRNRVTLG